MATTTILSCFAIPALVATVATVMPSNAEAQDFTNGALVGVVKTEAGTPAAGATVSIVGKTTGFKTTIKTDADGKFTLNQIPIGDYDVDIVAADGSKTSSSVQVALGSISNYNFTTSAQQVVVVRGKARRNLDFNRTTTGQVLDVQQVANTIPIGRSLNALAAIVPQISINSVFGSPSISGASPAENIYYIDGMNVTNFRNFVGGSTIPFDFYDQLEVKTGGYNSEYGRSTGGAFIATSRSGSNTWHGGAAYYFAPKSMSNKGAVAVNNLDGDVATYAQQVGGDYTESNFWLSGPLWKDHLFFFGFYSPRDDSDEKDINEGNGTRDETLTTVHKDPFYGGKLTFQLNPQQRLDYTYIKDQQDVYTHDVTDHEVLANGYEGGLTRILKYTGRFTDWFTLTAMAGSSTFDQTSQSNADLEPLILESTGVYSSGNSAGLVASGKDYRKNYRIDADFYYNFFGHHHTKVGADKEDLFATSVSSYSGHTYYRFYGAGATCGGYTPDGINNCVRVRDIEGGGSFHVYNTAFYVQDDWALTDRLNLNLGFRNDTFDNRNAANLPFIKTTNQIAPRIGASYDLFGDKTTKITAFYGRYYLPIAANTNIRESGGESFTQKYYTYTGRNSDGTPILGTWLNTNPSSYVLEDGVVPEADTLVSQNIKPQYEDEFILGYEQHLSNGWKFGVHATYRNLANVLEDSSLAYGNIDVCSYLNLATCGTFGSSNYIIGNPGQDIIIKLGPSFGADSGKTVTIPAAKLGMPHAKRFYKALEFDFERPDDGKYMLGGSLVLSQSKGNYEGGVKTDNAQADTGITQDFDEVGWVDGANGLLPNHHGYVLKAYGAYHWNDRLTFGFNGSIISPRKYGCIGYYPTPDDGRADSQTLTAWYCNGVLTPRGSSFNGDWIKNLDVSASYTIPTSYGSVKLGADIFNLLDAQGVDAYIEQGETSGPGTPSLNYHKPSTYQSPRYVRLSVKYSF